jgi:hypothetical protein
MKIQAGRPGNPGQARRPDRTRGQGQKIRGTAVPGVLEDFPGLSYTQGDYGD